MPWTEKEFAFLQSKGSPLTEAQKRAQRDEAHANPELVHKNKSALQMARERAGRS